MNIQKNNKDTKNPASSEDTERKAVPGHPKRIARDLTTGNVPRQMISFATPLFFSSLLQTMYNMVDMIVVGRFVGKNGLAAVSIGGDVMMFLSFVAMGFSGAGQVIIAQFIGAGQHEKVSRLIGTMFTFLFSCAIIVGVIGLVFQEQVLRWVNTPHEAIDFARSYTGVCMSSLVFIYGYNIVSGILRGMGDSRHPFMFVAIAAILNLILDLVFVIIFHWAIFGVALATVLSQGFSFIWAIIFLYRRRDAFGFDFKLRSFAIDKEVLKPFLKLGIPMMLQGASISFSKLFVNSWINSYGVLPSAMTGIGNKVGSIVNVVNIALATAGSTMIGQCIGAEKYDRVTKILKVSFSINIAISTVMGVLTVSFPAMIFGIFTNDPEVLKLAMTYIPVVLLLFAGSALRPPMSSLINGSGNFKLNLTVALLDGVFMRIGLSMFMGLVLGLGVYGFWYGSALASFTPFAIGTVYYLSGRWRTRKYIIRH